jgi:hypothetical protein
MEVAMGIRSTPGNLSFLSSLAEEVLIVMGYLMSIGMLAATQFVLNRMTSSVLVLHKPMQEVVLISEIVFVQERIAMEFDPVLRIRFDSGHICRNWRISWIPAGLLNS